MANELKRDSQCLGDRKDFWNVPCNPILGYRMQKINNKVAARKVPELFFTDDHKILKQYS